MSSKMQLTGCFRRHDGSEWFKRRTLALFCLNVTSHSQLPIPNRGVRRSLGEHGIWGVSRGLNSTIYNTEKNIVVIYYSKSYTISENLNAKPFLIWKIQAIYGQTPAHQWLEEIFWLFDKIFLEKQLVRGSNVAQKPKKCCGSSHWALDLCNLKKIMKNAFFS